MAPNEAGGAGDGSGRSQAEAEVRKCRANLAAGLLPHAAFHLGQALFHDPSLTSTYAVLADIAEAAGTFEAARELFKGDGNGVFAGNAAAIVALIAGDGRVPRAVELLGSLVAADPVKPWAAAPWFSPELAGSLPEISIGKAVTAVWQAVGNPAPPETVSVLTPWLALARTGAGRPDFSAEALCTCSALARRLGAYQDAVDWCRAAVAHDTRSEGRPTQPTLIMLGYAHRDAGQPDQAIDAWQRAAAVGPENADLLLDLADLTLDQGDVGQSLSWAERAGAVGGSAPTYRAAVLTARYRAGRQAGEAGDIAALTAIVDLALAHPETPYFRSCVARACEGATWLQTVPTPTEAVCESYGTLAAIEESGQGRITGVRTYSTSLEAPTPTAVQRRLDPDRFGRHWK